MVRTAICGATQIGFGNELKKRDAEAYERDQMTSRCELINYWSKD
jgi:hypothetical protein